MIISDLLPPPIKEVSTVTPAMARLNVGDLLTGRITQLNDSGQGVVRFPDGSGFAFQGASSLRPGEAVQVEVLRAQPDLTFRLLTSSSQTATELATSAEQSLVRAPDIFANLLRWSGQAAGHRALLQRSLPNVAIQHLLHGELMELAQLLETGSRQDVRAMIQQLRQGALELLLAEPQTGSTPAPPAPGTPEAQAIRNTLHRLGDLLAMQDILPRLPPAPDGSQLLGYRLFWLMEGGLGEAIWYKKRERQEQEADPAHPPGETTLTTVLLSLNMTNLGAVQARLSYGSGLCSIHIAAEEEEALSALRMRVGELRLALLSAELPMGTLDLTRLAPGELKENRMRALGMASHFAAEA
ncbi:MAG: flagellar hook-length control protein FliK [Magnetococcus sp. DMHC-8]